MTVILTLLNNSHQSPPKGRKFQIKKKECGKNAENDDFPGGPHAGRHRPFGLWHCDEDKQGQEDRADARLRGRQLRKPHCQGEEAVLRNLGDDRLQAEGESFGPHLPVRP